MSGSESPPGESMSGAPLERPTPEELEAYVAGELDAAGCARVEAALVRDPDVAAELESALQLRALTAEAATLATGTGRSAKLAGLPTPAEAAAIAAHGTGAAPAPVISLAARRRRLAIGTGTLVAAAAAAGLVWWKAAPTDAPPPAPDLTVAVVAELAPHRAIEPRLSWDALDRHRAYDVPRAAAGTPGESLSYPLMARVAELGDPRALAGAQLVTGRLAEAEVTLDAAPSSADTLSDRAALALLRGDPDLAIVHSAAALELDPAHPQAHWNHALALAALHLDRSAVAELRALAAGGDPAWAAEAGDRADAIEDGRARALSRADAANAAGVALIRGGAVDQAALDAAAASPDRMRLYFYDAMRTAATAARIAELRPLAALLDRHFGDGALSRWLDRIAASDLRARAPLAARYATLYAERTPGPAAALADAALRAGIPDLALGAMYFTGSARNALTPATAPAVAPARLPRYREVAATTGDPWFALLAIEQTGWSLAFDYQDADAYAMLVDGMARCEQAQLLWRCVRVAPIVVWAQLMRYELTAAAALFTRAQAWALQLAEPGVEMQLLEMAGWLAIRRDDVDARWYAVTDAYFKEREQLVVAMDSNCAAHRDARTARARRLITLHRLDAARAVFAGAASCPAPMTVEELFVRAPLVTTAAEAAEVRAGVAAVRAVDTAPDQQRALDHIEGRAAAVTDPTAAAALLHRAIDGEGSGALAAEARVFAYGLLIDLAAERAAWAEVGATVAAEAGVAALPACSLVLSLDREETQVAVGAAGELAGVRVAVTPATLGRIAPAVAAGLVGCDDVAVFARTAYRGRPQLLPADRAWHFAGGTHRAAAALDRDGATVVVSGATPPAALGLPALRPAIDAAGARVIEGAAATPDAVLAALTDASYVEIHAHGVVRGDDLGAAFLALSPGARGDYMLTGTAVAAQPLARHPIVLLAACHSAAGGGTMSGGGASLADAFLAAGAAAVIASPAPIADAGAPKFFAALRARIAAGSTPAIALRDERGTWTDPAQRAWIDSLVVFE
jgi:cellulose synthase operon protein C